MEPYKNIEIIGAIKETVTGNGYTKKSLTHLSGQELIGHIIDESEFEGDTHVNIAFSGAQENIAMLGIRFSFPVSGELFNRHVGFVCERGMFYEGVQPMYVGGGIWGKKNPNSVSSTPEMRRSLYERQQLDGQFVELDRELMADFSQVVDDNAAFSDFRLIQFAPKSYTISKRTKEGHAFIDAVKGNASKGTAFIGSGAAIFALSFPDLSIDAPRAIEISGMLEDRAYITLWLVHPMCGEFISEIPDSVDIYVRRFTQMPGKQAVIDFANDMQRRVQK